MNQEQPVDDQPQAEWTMVACGHDEVTGKRRCTYSWADGSVEMFVVGEHPIHRKGLGRLVRPAPE
jgi:prepilin-type processing-associated H-X9-DG protein